MHPGAPPPGARARSRRAAGGSVAYAPGAGRHLYLVPARGAVEVNGVRIGARDGAAISGEDRLQVRALEDAEIVMVDSL